MTLSHDNQDRLCDECDEPWTIFIERPDKPTDRALCASCAAEEGIA